MAAMGRRQVPRVRWACPVNGPECLKFLLLRPGDAKRRKCCSLACRNTARFHSLKQMANKIQRVMFVHGLSEAEARVYLRGWKDGRSAASQAYRHHKNLVRMRVGSEAWEKTA